MLVTPSLSLSFRSLSSDRYSFSTSLPSLFGHSQNKRHSTLVLDAMEREIYSLRCTQNFAASKAFYLSYNHTTTTHSPSIRSPKQVTSPKCLFYLHTLRPFSWAPCGFYLEPLSESGYTISLSQTTYSDVSHADNSVHDTTLPTFLSSMCALCR